MNWIPAILFLLGSVYIFAAAVGIVRMPDLYTRMQGTSKASTLGAMLILIGFAVGTEDSSDSFRVLAICLFIFLTAPVVTHLLAKAGYLMRVAKDPKNVVDDLEGRYDPKSFRLASMPEPKNVEKTDK